MAKALITADAVAAAADQLLAEGQDPTLILVQQRLGGGSYSTVKKYLDGWKTQRESPPPATPVPPALIEQAQLIVTRLWGEALRVDDARIAQIQTEAQAQIQGAQHALAQAEAIIAQHEADAEAAQLQLAQLTAERSQLLQQITHLEQTTLAATTQADALRGELATLNTTLTAAQAHLIDQARLEGELTALRRQLDDQAVLITRLTDRPNA